VGYLDQEGVGLSFGIPYYVNYSNLWSSLVSSFVNAQSLLTYIPYLYFSQPLTINGMFFVIKKKVLQHIGGFDGLETQLCDDVAIAERVRRYGLELKQTSVRHAISTTVVSGQVFHQLLLRWLIFPKVSLLPNFLLQHVFVFMITVFFPVFLPVLMILATIFRPEIWLLTSAYWVLLLCIFWRLNRKFLYQAGRLLGMIGVQLIVPWYVLLALLHKNQITWRGKRIEVLASNKIIVKS
jgi:ceramide glucosyltransferase